MCTHLKNILLCFIIGIIYISTFAQTLTDESFRKEEDSIRYLLNVINKTHNDDSKILIETRIDSLFEKVLSNSESYNYPFDSLTSVGHIYSPDRLFRIITWNIALENGTYKYHGYIQTFNIKTKEYKYFHLNDCKENIIDPEHTILNADKWFGALYYNIIPQKANNMNYYTLLALQYYNINISHKIIEILYFNDSGEPVFGAPIIQEDKKLYNRLVFRYSAQVAMNLRFDKKLKMIIFDHLSPVEQRYTGEYEYYGPDLSYDGLEFKNNLWVYKSNIDLPKPDAK